MLEIPESSTIAKQLNDTVRGKVIRKAAANFSPHKFAFYHGDPANYGTLLFRQIVGDSYGIGSMVEINAGCRRIVLGDGANLRYYEKASTAPNKHQLIIEFEDESTLVCTVAMYGAVLAFSEGECNNKYYLLGKKNPLPINASFNRSYFDTLFVDGWEKMSSKAFLATRQRIPGLGNGSLQDILFNAHVHPQRRMGTLSDCELDEMFSSVKNTLCKMTNMGGRDTERDLFGNSGGYKTAMSKNTVGKPCAACGSEIQKEAFLGGAIYWCPTCQPLKG